MTIKEIKERVKRIMTADQTYDHESAHSQEDNLRKDFIIYVAKRKDHLSKKAKLILKSNKDNFPRWCA